MKHIARKARVRFERHCGFWPNPKQCELFSREALKVRDSQEPLPRGPEPLVPDSPEWWDAVQGRVSFVPHGYGVDSSDLERRS